MPSATPSDGLDPDAALAEYGRLLADAIDSALAAWVVSQVRRVGGEGLAQPALMDELIARCRHDVMVSLRGLLELDVDDQRSTPLSEVGRAVAPVTEYLSARGVPPAIRDPFDVSRDPFDVYGLTPRTWSDLGPSVAEQGMTWGAAKAFVHLARRRR